MKTKRTYFPPTTPQQRKLLFETWEQTNNVTAACRKAHVGRATFYYWKPRFDRDGYAGLEAYEKAGVPKGTGRVAIEIEAKVLELYGQHEGWGKHRLADEVAKANNWVQFRPKDRLGSDWDRLGWLLYLGRSMGNICPTAFT